jgi:hypothetical protein
MRFLFIVAIIAMAGTCLQAQKVAHTAVKTPIFKDEYRGSSLVDVQDDGKGGSVIIRSQVGSFLPLPKGYIFEHYDAEMKKNKEYIYENKNSYVMGVVVNNGSIHVIDLQYNKQRKAYVWFASTASLTDFKFTQKELFEVAGKEAMLYAQNNRGGFDLCFSMVMSADKSAFGLIVNTKRTQEIRRIYVYDKDLNQKFMHNFDAGISSRGLGEMSISPNGEAVYMLAKVATEETKDKDEGGKYEYRLYSIDKDGYDEQSFGVDEHFVRFMHASIFEDKVICTGFFSDKKDKKAKGICYFEMDPKTLEINKSKYSEFTPQFFADKYGRDTDKEVKFIDFKNLSKTVSGDYILFAEESYITTTKNYNSFSSTYVMHYNDIVCARIDKEGNLIWARNINKKQSTSGDTSYLSYTPIVSGENAYFFINANSKVDSLTKDRIEFGQPLFKSWSHLNIIEVTASGNFEYEEIDEDKEGVPFMVNSGITTPSGIYFLGRSGSEKQLLKVNFPG